MALGTITQQNLQPVLVGVAGEPGSARFGPLKVSRYSVVGDSSYVTGGSPLTAAQLGFGPEGVVLMARVSIKAATGTNSGAIAARYDEVNQKLQCFVTAGVSPVQVQEAAAAANLSGITWEIEAYGYPATS